MKVSTVFLAEPHPNINVWRFDRTGLVRLTQDNGAHNDDVLVLPVDEVPNLIAALQQALEQP
jgi:hypothetical protein